MSDMDSSSTKPQARQEILTLFTARRIKAQGRAWEIMRLRSEIEKPERATVNRIEHFRKQVPSNHHADHPKRRLRRIEPKLRGPFVANDKRNERAAVERRQRQQVEYAKYQVQRKQ